MPAAYLAGGLLVEASGGCAPDQDPTSRYHRGSHRELLAQAPRLRHPSARVDALLVPTHRSVEHLNTAIRLAAELDCTLVALCSDQITKDDIASHAVSRDVDLVSIDTTKIPVGLMPTFATNTLLAGHLLERTADTSLKRNLGLLLSRLIGWHRALFLDDDIAVPDTNHLRSAAHHLDTYASVGLDNIGWPDNSVVCHAYRETHGQQKTFIGSGALAFSGTTENAFFPQIYNEDWFFLLDKVSQRRVAVTGEVFQEHYDPYSDIHRAQSEEFGECLAEGLFWRLDHGLATHNTDHDFWTDFLNRRRAFIDEVRHRVTRLVSDPARRSTMLEVLATSRTCAETITPRLCLDYLRRWERDRTAWAEHLETLSNDLSSARLSGGPTDAIDAVLEFLGLVD